MSNNFNEAAENAAEAEARKRAERIAAIRKAVKASSEAPSREEIAAKKALSDAEAAVNGRTSPAAEMSWEDEIAARIASRVQKVKANKASSAEEILRELDSSTGSEHVGSVSDILNELDNAANSAHSGYEGYSEMSEYSEEKPAYERTAAETVPEGNASEEAVYSDVPAAYDEPQVPVTAYEAADEAPAYGEITGGSENTGRSLTADDIVKEAPAAAKPIRKLKRPPVSHEAAPSREAVMPETTSAQAAEPKKSASKKKKKKKKKSFRESFLGLFPQKKDSVLERIRKVIFLGAIAVIIVCGYIVGDYYIDLWRSKRENAKTMNSYWNTMQSEKTTDSNEPDNRRIYTLLSGAEKLLDENSDVVGVIRIEGTPVNNPVMQADDNSKYLNRKLSGRESRAGELFLDYRNHFDEVDEDGHLIVENSDNLVIYGHNMKDEEMFGSLKFYDWYDYYYGEHPVIELNSNYEQYKYKIFAFFILDAEDETDTKFDCWNKLDFGSEEEFYDFVNEAKRRTLRNTDVDVKYGDKLLTLSTCNTVLGDRGRLIVLARLVRDDEDPLEGTQNSTENTNIKWPSLYYDYKGSAKRYDPEADFVPYGPSDEAEQEASGEKK